MEQDSSSSSTTTSCGRKREREEEEEEDLEEQQSGRSDAPPPSKRFCERNVECSSLEDDDDGQDLASILEEAEHSLRREQPRLVSDVMKSLEEAISSSDSGGGVESRSPNSPEPSRVSPAQQAIGYLLEASDDELGLEPNEFDQPALVEEEDLVRGESWSNSDWSAACAADFSDDFIELGPSQQEWLRRALETIMSSGAAASVATIPPPPASLGQGFEPPIAGLIL